MTTNKRTFDNTTSDTAPVAARVSWAARGLVALAVLLCLATFAALAAKLQPGELTDPALTVLSGAFAAGATICGLGALLLDRLNRRHP